MGVKSPPVAPADTSTDPPAGDGRTGGWLVAALVVLLVVLALGGVVLVGVFLTEPVGGVAVAPSALAPTSEATSATAALLSANFPVSGTPASAATAAATSTLAATPAPAVSPTPCKDNNYFVADVTLPDGAVVYADRLIAKTWRVRNTGTCAWGPAYRLQFLSGDKGLSGQGVPVPDTPPGGTADITVPLTAPKSLGLRSSAWRMVNGRKEEFGQTFSVNVNVQSPPVPTPTPTVTPTPTPGPLIRLWIEPQVVQAGQKAAVHVETDDVAAAWLDGDVILGGHESREVAPCADTVYTLDVQLKNGQHEYRDAGLQVTGRCADDGAPDGLSLDYRAAGVPLAVGLSTVISYTLSNAGPERVDGLSLTFDPGISPTQLVTIERGLGFNPGDQLEAAFSFAWPAAGTYQTRFEVEGGLVSRTLSIEVR